MATQFVSITSTDKLKEDIEELLEKSNLQNNWPHELITKLPDQASDLEFIVTLAVYTEALIAKLLEKWIDRTALHEWLIDNTRHGQRLDLVKQLRADDERFPDAWIEALRALSIIRNRYAHNIDALQSDLPSVAQGLDQAVINKIAAACRPLGHSAQQPMSELIPNIRCAILTAVLPALATIHAEIR